jgi:cbb3-type cytochrome oxidase subunit 3
VNHLGLLIGTVMIVGGLVYTYRQRRKHEKDDAARLHAAEKRRLDRMRDLHEGTPSRDEPPAVPEVRPPDGA